MPKKTFLNLPKEKQDSLIAIALKEFAKRDYNSASISAIVRQAGIAQGSLYQYFANKKDLYLYLLELLSQTKLSFLHTHDPPESNTNFFEYLNWMFETSLEFDLAYPDFSRLGYRAFYGDLPFQDPAIERLKQASSQWLRQIVLKGIEAGDLDPELDLDLAVFTIETLSNAIPEKLGTTKDELLTEGSSSFSRDAAKNLFQELIKVLQFGMSIKGK